MGAFLFSCGLLATSRGIKPTALRLELGDYKEAAYGKPMRNWATGDELQSRWLIQTFQVMNLGSSLEAAQATFGICGLRICFEPHL